jgi:hypothetical protein
VEVRRPKYGTPGLEVVVRRKAEIVKHTMATR